MRFCKAIMAAVALHSCVVCAADFFPLGEGNRWSYRETRTGETFNVQVGLPVSIAGHIYYPLTGYAESELFVRIEEVFGALMYWDEERGQEILLTSFEPFEGGRWIAPFRPCPEQTGQTQLKRGTHDGPAGPISDVLEIRYLTAGCADVGLIQEQYAEHLGMLRRIQNSIAGPRTFELVSARVGQLRIDAAPSSTFTVSAALPYVSNSVRATFRLQVRSSSALSLSFSSGQEFDFTLNDGGGNTLWRWSAGRTFVEALHQRIVADEWSETVEIPWPTAPDGGLQAGDYTVQAWVTATGSTALSAILPVAIAPR